MATMWFFAGFGFGVGFVVFVCFVFFSSCGRHRTWTISGLRRGPCSLLRLQRGDDARCCTIRSTDTNTVLRPGESREGDGGRKKSKRILNGQEFE